MSFIELRRVFKTGSFIFMRTNRSNLPQFVLPKRTVAIAMLERLRREIYNNNITLHHSAEQQPLQKPVSESILLDAFAPFCKRPR